MVLRSEELKHSQFLLDFLFEEDLKNFVKVVKDSEKLLGPRQINEYVTNNGLAKVQYTTSSTQFCLKMPDYIDSYKILYQELMDCSAEVHDKSNELAASMLRLHKNLEQLSELNRMIKCQS